MEQHLTISIQDYLKTIYDLLETNGSASTTALASRLGIAPASVTGMIQRLASGNPPLVDYRKHQGVTLTSTGKRAALEVIRHHRLIETYLVKSLGYSWDEVHAEADRLEHVISEDFEARIAAALGNPTYDPHGEPIPSSELTMPEDKSVILSSLLPLQKAQISRVRPTDPAFLRHLEGLGLIPGAILEVVEVSFYDHNLTLHIENRRKIVIGEVITSQIFVVII
jgi:DtxR family transcriptional regulator, Mn-dependent transcriptional regulator